jgi:hypothetical protein
MIINKQVAHLVFLNATYSYVFIFGVLDKSITFINISISKVVRV